MTSRGVPERSTGPDVRFPAPVMVVLSSPNVVSDAGQRDWYAPRTWSALTAWWSSRVVIRGAGLGDFLAVAAGQDRVVLGGPDQAEILHDRPFDLTRSDRPVKCRSLRGGGYNTEPYGISLIQAETLGL